MTASTRVCRVSEAAARGDFPAEDWDIEFLARPERLAGAVIAYTGHHLVAADVSPADFLGQLDPDDPSSLFKPATLAWLGDRIGTRPGHVDVVLAAAGSGQIDSRLVPIDTPPDNERVRRARRQRAEVGFWSAPDGSDVVTVGQGLGGRWEIGLEITEVADRNRGLGRQLAQAARGLVAPGEFLFASVAPGNTRSLRCFMAAGFVPIGAECLFV